MPTLKSIAQEATNRAGLKVPSSHANQQTQMQSIGTTAPTISQSGKKLFNVPTYELSVTTVRQLSLICCCHLTGFLSSKF